MSIVLVSLFLNQKGEAMQIIFGNSNGKLNNMQFITTSCSKLANKMILSSFKL